MSSEWKTIESADRPRKSEDDPLDILLWDGIRMAVGHWSDQTTIEDELVSSRNGRKVYQEVENVWGFWEVDGDFLTPTHWMPLPAPPRITKEE